MQTTSQNNMKTFPDHPFTDTCSVQQYIFEGETQIGSGQKSTELGIVSQELIRKEVPFMKGWRVVVGILTPETAGSKTLRSC